MKRTPTFHVSRVRIDNRRKRFSKFRIASEQRKARPAPRLMTKTIEFWNQPNSILPCGCGKFFGVFASDKTAIAQFWMRPEIIAVIDFNDDDVDADGCEFR